MGRFKESRNEAIEKQKEMGDSALEKGNQRFQELQKVKSLIDSIVVQDEDDIDVAESLNDSYLEAGREAHKEEVEEPVNDAKQELDKNKNEVTAEKGKVSDAVEKIQEMKSTTDLAKNEANQVETQLKNSVSEYEDMERQTDDIENELEQNSKNILDRIESLFN